MTNSSVDIANMGAQAKLSFICTAYKKLKPALGLVKTILFFKPKWKIVLTEFMELCDSICSNE